MQFTVTSLGVAAGRDCGGRWGDRLFLTSVWRGVIVRDTVWLGIARPEVDASIMPGTFELRNAKVRQLVHDHVPRGGAKPGAVLELSCGNAELLATLQRDGYAVRGTNFTAYPQAAPGVPIDVGVDLLRGLPYDEAAFDAVILLDVIEHLSDHDAVLRHLSRVLKLGGVLIIAAPNISNISSRLHFLFTGFFKVRRSFIGFDVPAEKSFAFHNYAPHLPVLLYQMHARAVPCERFESVGVKLKSVLFYVLLILPIWLCTLHRTGRQEKFLAGTPAGRMLLRRLTGFGNLCGELMILVGRRSEPTCVVAGRTSMPAWYHGPGSEDALGPRQVKGEEA